MKSGKCEIKRKEGRFLPPLAPLTASMLTGKGVMRAGKGAVRAGTRYINMDHMS